MTHFSLRDACAEMDREEKEVRNLLRKYPGLRPPRAFGDKGPYLCDDGWTAKFSFRADALAAGLCLHCGKKWDGEDPQVKAAETE